MDRRHARRALVAAWSVAAAVLAAGAPAAAAAARAPLEPPVTLPPPPAAAQAAAATQSGTPLDGLFRVDEGVCGDGGVEAGSWFRMIDPGGGHVENNDSPCGDRSWTPLSPGTDGGLLTGEYQPHPDPAFSGSGGGRNDRITQPASFFGVAFSTATNQVDPQTGADVPAPSIATDGGTLSGDLRAFAAAWSNQHFNQGSPKPDGSRPGDTTGPDGTYDEASGEYSLDWTSLIEGGPFNGFTGVWHLEGTFDGRVTTQGPEPGSPAPSPGDGGAPSQGSGSGGATPPAVAAGGQSAPSTGRHPRTGGPLGGALVLATGLAGLGGLAALRATRLPGGTRPGAARRGSPEA